MAERQTTKTEHRGRLDRLEAENAWLRRLAAELADDMTELPSPRGARGRDGAVDVAHRLLAGAPPRD